MTTTIRLRGPADMISVLPYQLGYRPTDSLVVVCLHGPRLGAIGRIDLPPADVDPAVIVRELLPLVLHERPHEVLLVAYESVTSTAGLVSGAMAAAVRSAGYPVADRLLVREDRWWSLDCTGPCCPAKGELLSDDADVPAVADFVVLGRQPARSRAALADRLRRVDDPVQDSRCAALMQDLRAATSRPRVLTRRRRTMFVAWARILAGEPRWPGRAALEPGSTTDDLSVLPAVGDQAWSWAVVSLLDVEFRDLLVAWLCPGTLPLSAFRESLRNLASQVLPRVDGDVAGVFSARLGTLDARDAELLERLAMVCRAAPPELSPGPLTVLAHVAWWQGDGALARTALEEALSVDPDYRLAIILEQMVDAAVRPQRTA